MVKRFFLISLSLMLMLSLIVTIFPQEAAHAAAASVTYEAEAGSLGNGALIDSSSNASGGQSVGGLHLTGAYNEVNHVDGGVSGGTYYLTIYYSSGDSAATKALLVNGTKVADLSVKNTGGWNTFYSQVFEISLNSGTTNTIRVQESGGGTYTYGVNIDKYVISPVTTRVSPSDQKYEAENGLVGNGAVLVSYTNASGSQVVGSLHLPNAYSEINHVDGGELGGQYYLTIRYASGDTQATKALFVNGTKVMDVIFKSTGGWNTFVNQTVVVTLNAGTSNTIRLQENGGGTFTYGVGIDRYALMPKDTRITGYIHPNSILTNDLDGDAYNHITDVIVLGFQAPDSSGNISTINSNWSQYVDQLDALIGSNKVKKWITITGNSTVFASMMGNPTARANYAANVLRIMNLYGFDGLDIDWEYPANSTQWNNFSAGLIELQQLLGKNGKDISLALAPWGVNLSPNAFASVEQINSMIYDLGYYHATFEQTVSAVNYFTNLGVPKSKLNLGLAWYGRPTDKTGFWADYDYLMDTQTSTTQISDETNLVRGKTVISPQGVTATKDVYFNGMDMNKRKMLLAQDKDLRGVMMWHLFADIPVSNSKSLLAAIVAEKDQHQQYRSLTNLALNQTYSASTTDGAYAAARAFDNNDTSTYWQAPAGVTDAVYLQVDFSQPTTLNTVVFKEHGDNVQSYSIQSWDGTQWVDAYTGGLMGAYKTVSLNSITTSKLRLKVNNWTSPNVPSSESAFTQYNYLGLYEFEVYNK